jgi:hypothetical protein
VAAAEDRARGEHQSCSARAARTPSPGTSAAGSPCRRSRRSPTLAARALRAAAAGRFGIHPKRGFASPRSDRPGSARHRTVPSRSIGQVRCGRGPHRRIAPADGHARAATHATRTPASACSSLDTRGGVRRPRRRHVLSQRAGAAVECSSQPTLRTPTRERLGRARRVRKPVSGRKPAT